MSTTPLKQSQSPPHLQQRKRKKLNRGNKAAHQTPRIHITIRLNVNRITIPLLDLINFLGSPRIPSKSPGQALVLHRKHKECPHLPSKFLHKVITQTPTQRLKITKIDDLPGTITRASKAGQMVLMHMKGVPL